MFHVGVRAAVERQIEETSAANIDRFKRDRSRAVNRSSLSELFVTFLAKVTPFCHAFYLKKYLIFGVGHNLLFHNLHIFPSICYDVMASSLRVCVFFTLNSSCFTH